MNRRMFIAAAVSFALASRFPALAADTSAGGVTILPPYRALAYQDILDDMLAEFERIFGAPAALYSCDWECMRMMAEKIWDVQQDVLAVYAQFNPRIPHYDSGIRNLMDQKEGRICHQITSTS
jgi:hypothetical protein